MTIDEAIRVMHDLFPGVRSHDTACPCEACRKYDAAAELVWSFAVDEPKLVPCTTTLGPGTCPEDAEVGDIGKPLDGHSAVIVAFALAQTDHVLNNNAPAPDRAEST